MKNLITATMESSILDELAAFNIRAPIAFSISFEDSNEGEEVTVKTENDTDDDNANSQVTNDLPETLLSPKKEIKEEIPETIEEQSCKDELNSDQHLEQNISKDITILQTEILHNTKTNSDDERKRKQELMQIYKNKRSKKDLTEENVTHNFSHNIESETFISNSHFAHHNDDTSQLNPISVVSTAALLPSNENEKEKIKSSIISCLAAVSENMRLVMEEYAHYRQYNTPYDGYKKQKFIYFNDSYNTVVKLIMPEEHNRDFILSFLHKTHEHALKNPGLNKCGFNDYVILLKELINWAKEKQKMQTPRKQENTVQPTLNQTTSKQDVNNVQPTLTSSNRQGVVLENTCNNTVDNGSNNRTKADTICIFSAGSPRSEISINIDPNLSQYLTTANSFTSQNKDTSEQTPKKLNDVPRTQMPFQTQLETEANNKNHLLQELLQRPPLIQQMPPFIPNDASELYPEMYKHMHTASSPVKRNPTNNKILNKQKNARLPQLHKQIEMQKELTGPGQSQLPQTLSMPSPRILPQTQPPVNTAHRQPAHAPPTIPTYDQLTRQPPPPYDKSIWTHTLHQHILSELENSRLMQSHYDPSKNMQQLSQPQHMLPQSNGQYGQYQIFQSNIGHLQNMQQKYGQLQRDQSTTGQLQNMQAQYRPVHQVPKKKGHSQNTQAQYGKLQQVQSSIEQLQNMQAQYGPLQQVPNKKGQSQNMQPHYGQLQVQSAIEQLQNMQAQYGPLQQFPNKKGQSQNMQPHYGQLQHVQNTIGQVQHMQPQYGQFQIGHLQNMQQYGQVPMREPQPVLPQHVSPEIGQPSPIPPDCEKRLQTGDWRQGLTELYHNQAQTQQLHRNAPRSTSTDSGFVSPLNFNTSSDQTVPPVPDDTEPSQILITHVTSLNPKVPFMAEGNCVICNEATKKVCMGCMKVYYCTYECQVKDWSTHGPNCYNQRPTTTFIRETNDDQLQT